MADFDAQRIAARCGASAPSVGLNRIFNRAENMKPVPPIRDDASGHCSHQCPHLMKWEHPFWHNTAWCDLQMRDLSFYDGYLADCIDNKPHPLLTSARDRLRFNAGVKAAAEGSPATEGSEP